MNDFFEKIGRMDRLQQLERETAVLRAEVFALRAQVSDLKAEVSELKRDLDALKNNRTPDIHHVEALLRQRGFPVLAHGDQSQLVFPPNLSRGQIDLFYNLMRRYSFRLFMRDLIQSPEGSDPSALTRYCSLNTVRSYLKSLAGLGIVAFEAGGSYRLAKRVPSFGPTLEWYVCTIFRREFLAPALFNVRLRNTVHGGDYDVVALLAGHLVYVEVKSSPPRGVEHQAVSAFLNRVRELQPNLAIFLVDTELRMKDKLAPLLAEGLEQEGRSGAEWPVLRLVDEIFHVRHTIYLTNSRKGVYTNLRTCYRDFSLWEGKSGHGPEGNAVE